MNANAIEANGLSKCYRIYDHPRDRLLQTLWGRDRRGQPKQSFREFWALQEVSFCLGRGQTLGVVGRNGSGKSTLLQLLCGTLQPTTGDVRMQGRIGALLELGSGFNPEFNGLENVFLNASLLGLSRAETEARLDQILGFADIGEFVDQPVKTYSSGMAVRLAFAVQAHIDPDVLVVDEALAVGDELFQKKCYSHLERLKERGTSVLLVTHSCPQIIQHCDQALLLHKGKARMLGEPARITVTYQRLINAGDAEWDAAFADTAAAPLARATITPTPSPPKPVSEESSDAWFDPNLIPQSSEIYPSHGGRITDVWIERESGERVNVLPFGEGFVVVFCYAADQPLYQVALACHLASLTGQQISGQSLPEEAGPQAGGQIKEVLAAGSNWQVRFCFRGGLWPGLYFIGGGILSYAGQELSFVHRVIDFRALRVLAGRPVQMIGACSMQASPAVMKLASTIKPPMPRPAPAET